jgi:hypothetical protein
MADPRVTLPLTYTLPSPLAPPLLGLLLLRSQYRREFINQPNASECPLIQNIEKIEQHRKDSLAVHLVSDLVNLCLEYVPDLFCHVSLDPLPVDLHDNNGRFGFSCAHLSTM